MKGVHFIILNNWNLWKEMKEFPSCIFQYQKIIIEWSFCGFVIISLYSFLLFSFNCVHLISICWCKWFRMSGRYLCEETILPWNQVWPRKTGGWKAKTKPTQPCSCSCPEGACLETSVVATTACIMFFSKCITFHILTWKSCFAFTSTLD